MTQLLTKEYSEERTEATESRLEGSQGLQLLDRKGETMKVTERKWGWLKDEENFSSPLMLAMRDDGPLDLPEVDIDSLPVTGGIADWLQMEDQGRMGACAGHAATSCAEIAYHRQTGGKIIQFNRRFQYLAAQKIDGISGDRGSTISGNATSMQQVGMPLEVSWPYVAEYPRGGWQAIPGKLWQEAKQFRIRLWRDLKNYSEVVKWLVHGIGGVDIGIQWNVEPDSLGRVLSYRQAGGGHSVTLGDWNKRFLDRRKRPFIRLANSWGLRWGIRGWADVHPDIVDEWCDRQTVVGISDMLNIVPRPIDWNAVLKRI